MAETDRKQKPFHREVADNLIKHLESGTAPWQKPLPEGQNAIPMNPTTGKSYTGVNALNLMLQDKEDPRWLSYNQAKEAGLQVKAGEKATPIQFWSFTEKVNKIDPVTGQPELGKHGFPIKEEIKLERPVAKVCYVYNASQIEGMPPLEVKPRQENPQERVDKIIENCGVTIKHDQKHSASYSKLFDEVHLPAKGKFSDGNKYYETVLHELSHATGHDSRQDREMKSQFGNEKSPHEELVATMSTMFACAETGIPNDPSRNASLTGAWIKELQDHPMEVCKTAQQADVSAKMVLSMEREQTLDQEQGKESVEPLPRWVDKLEVRACREDEEGNVISQGVPNHDAEFFGVYAKLENGLEQHLKDFDSKDRAHDYAYTLENERSRDERESETAPPVTGDLTYIKVPFEERLEARELGAEFDSNAKSWYIPDGADAQAITDKWPEHDPAATRAEQQEKRDELATKQPEGRMYINVPRAEKDEAKELGARWDGKAVSWYVPENTNPEPLTSRWHVHEPAKPVAEIEEQTAEKPLENKEKAGIRWQDTYVPRDERQYLVVPYQEKNQARAAGAKWDPEQTKWYAGKNADMEKLSKWLPENQVAVQPSVSPRDELASVLKSLGGIADGNHPIMDKQPHRFEVEGDKQGERSGFYIAHPDGRPAGYAVNNRTKEEKHWVASGHSMDDAERQTLREKAAVALKERQEERDESHDKTAEKLQTRFAKQKPPQEPTPYLATKGIQIHQGVFASGKTTCVPAHDVSGKIRSVQYIREDGSKRFAKNSEREGCFHPVGGMDSLKKSPVIVVSEGYATAASIKEATGRATVAAFDTANILPVAKALRQAFPDKPIIIAGDNDLHNEKNGKENTGKKFAQEAAAAVKGAVVFPTFATGEVDRDAKGFKDFNDLATKSVLGKEAVKSQIDSAIERHTEKVKNEVEAAKTKENTKEKESGKEAER